MPGAAHAAALDAAMAKVSKFKPLTALRAVCAMPLMRRPPVELRITLPGRGGEAIGTLDSDGSKWLVGW